MRPRGQRSMKTMTVSQTSKPVRFCDSLVVWKLLHRRGRVSRIFLRCSSTYHLLFSTLIQLNYSRSFAHSSGPRPSDTSLACPLALVTIFFDCCYLPNALLRRSTSPTVTMDSTKSHMPLYMPLRPVVRALDTRMYLNRLGVVVLSLDST